MSAWVGRISRQGRGRDCSASSSNPMMEGPPGADSEEKHEPVSDIDTVVVDSLKALDPEWPIREADMFCLPTVSGSGPHPDVPPTRGLQK